MSTYVVFGQSMRDTDRKYVETINLLTSLSRESKLIGRISASKLAHTVYIGYETKIRFFSIDCPPEKLRGLRYTELPHDKIRDKLEELGVIKDGRS